MSCLCYCEAAKDEDIVAAVGLHCAIVGDLVIPVDGLSLGNAARERAGATAVCQRRRLPAARADHVRRRPRRDVAVPPVDGGDAARLARPPPHGPPDRTVDRPAPFSINAVLGSRDRDLETPVQSSFCLAKVLVPRSGDLADKFWVSVSRLHSHTVQTMSLRYVYK